MIFENSLFCYHLILTMQLESNDQRIKTCPRLMVCARHGHYAAEILRDDPYLIHQVEVNRFLVIRWESRTAIPPAVSTGQP